MKKYSGISWLQKEATLTTITNEEMNNLSIEKGKTTSAFCFIFEGNQVILLEHANSKRGYDIPGGHLENNETPLEAMEREVLEEVGCLIKNIKPIGCQIIEKLYPEEKYPDLISNQMFFKAELKEILNIDLEKDSKGIKKMSIEDFSKYLLAENKIEIIDLFNFCLK